jgi:hypothetical protein
LTRTRADCLDIGRTLTCGYGFSRPGWTFRTGLRNRSGQAEPGVGVAPGRPDGGDEDQASRCQPWYGIRGHVVSTREWCLAKAALIAAASAGVDLSKGASSSTRAWTCDLPIASIRAEACDAFQNRCGVRGARPSWSRFNPVKQAFSLLQPPGGPVGISEVVAGSQGAGVAAGTAWCLPGT